MRRMIHILAGILVVTGGTVYARSVAPANITFPDGAVGSVATECGTGDLCATLTLPNKDVISIYNEGATWCQPFKLKMLRMQGSTILLSSESETAYRESVGGAMHPKCTGFKDTYMTFDEGQATLGLYLSHDGSLYAQWYTSTSEAHP